MRPRTLFEKLWDAHMVRDLGDGRALIHVDRHILHDVTSPQAFAALAAAGRPVRNPELTFATADHIVSTAKDRGDASVPGGAEMVRALREACRTHGIRNFDIGDPAQGIVHVIAPELGIALPGLTLACGDSHACTVGALGAWAWGIGTSDVAHVLATQTLVVQRPRTARIRFEGSLRTHVGAKDMILSLVQHIGVGGALGHAVEFAGDAVRRLPMEARFTLCNMAVEASAATALIAPDFATFDYVASRPYAPQDEDFDTALAAWFALPSDAGSVYGREMALDVTNLAPMVTWGTSPEHAVAIDGVVPHPSSAAHQRALAYQGLVPGAPIAGTKIDRVFIGSCTNARLSDLQAAAAILDGRKIAPHVRATVVPGSGTVKRDAEALGLHRVFEAAGFDWREPGCSMCAGLNGDGVAPGERCIATSNRNFEGRQGPGTRTHLASPVTAAASAVAGAIADVRRMEG
ncbi:MAG: 3-isopropylmalate dehydratase large subunit [Proteobacteria bacterium]|nr:3-isopropylmalate dehydratase large subunit [Pseudomonadota bacterium]